jgi:hypothetical protein
MRRFSEIRLILEMMCDVLSQLSAGAPLLASPIRPYIRTSSHRVRALFRPFSLLAARLPCRLLAPHRTPAAAVAMLHPTTWHVESWREHLHNEVLQTQVGSYAHASIRPALPGTNLHHVPPSLLRPRAYTAGALNSTVLGAGGLDRIAPVRRAVASAAMPLGSGSQGPVEVFAPPSAEQLETIRRYGHCAELPYNSADFPQRLGATRRGVRREALDLHPLQWDPSLDQTSSRQFRSRDEQGVHFRSHLHPPLTPTRGARPASSSAAAASYGVSARESASAKRYHRPMKPSLPELNKATYIQYLANTQPLLSACIAGRRRCQMSVWRDELLKRKIDPHAQFIHKS